MPAPLLVDQHGDPVQSRPAGHGQRLANAAGSSFYDAASRSHPDLAMWQPGNPSAQSALSYERDRIASRVHDLGRNDGWAASSVTRLVDSIIGSGWRLSSKPNARRLGIEPEAAQELALEIEAAWREYECDFESCDAGQRLDMGGVLALAFRHRVEDGESLSVSYWTERGAAYSTSIGIIDPDRLSNPQQRVDSVSMRGGIELGEHGEPLAYHIRTAHPGDLGVIGAYPWRWERVERKYGNGRWQVVHAFEPKRAGQVRGEPPITPVLKRLRMLGRYDEAELQAAVINALLAVFIKSPNDHEQLAEAMNSADEKGMSSLQESRTQFYEQSGGIRLPSARVNFLFPTDQVEFTKPTHPNSGYEHFTRSVLRNIAAATGLSYEQLSMDWSQVNYSSARAALLEVWRGFTARKDNFASQFMAPHFANWLEEAIARGRVKLPKGAPSFREARAAYCSARWIGPARGWVDPQKEAAAALERLGGGLSTLERECAEQGLDYIDVLDQRARERKEMIARGLDPDTQLRSKLPIGTQPGDKEPAPAGQQKPQPKNSDDEGDA